MFRQISWSLGNVIEKSKAVGLQSDTMSSKQRPGVSSKMPTTRLMLLLTYLFVSHVAFAQTTQSEGAISSDHNHPVIEPSSVLSDNHISTDRPQLGEVSRQWLHGQNRGLDEIEERVRQARQVKRAPDGVSALANNAPQNMNVAPGETQNWLFPADAISGPHGLEGVGFPSDPSDTGNMTDDGPFRRELKRQSGTPIWITINTCLQPESTSGTQDTPPQLQLYYSTSSDDDKPGPSTGAIGIDVIGGFGIIEIDASDDVYIGVSAANTTQVSGSWNYEIAASNDAPYHFWSNQTDLLFVDGDNHAALLVTPDLYNASSNSPTYQQWLQLQAPYGMFAHDQTNTSILGVSRSYCGLRHNAKIMANIPEVENNNVATMTSRGLNGYPKEQFYISALSAASNYYGFLAMTGNSTHSGSGVIGGGGRVWTNMTFRTKASDNCALMYNLTFCSEVAYAVPSNPENYSPTEGLASLGAVYDTYASDMYRYFDYSLQQIPCNTTDTAQYSLARGCDDCARAYKQWLCAVTIPRCEDWDNPASYLVQRNIAQNFTNGTVPSWVSSPGSSQQVLANAQTNSSRNSQIIDQIIQPGPYKEVLPCIDLCWDLVQSCPAALGFGCPIGKYQNLSYGVRDQDPGVLSCSYLGAAYYLSEGSSLHGHLTSRSGFTIGVVMISTLALLFS